MAPTGPREARPDDRFRAVPTRVRRVSVRVGFAALSPPYNSGERSSPRTVNYKSKNVMISPISSRFLASLSAGS
jgi:hypothetical protein